MVRIRLTKDRLFLVPLPGAMIATLRRRLVVPKSSVVDIAIYQQYDVPKRLRRRVGTSIPGLLLAGSYRSDEGRHFYYLAAGNEAIKLTLRDHKFKTICVDVKDSVDSATRIISWLDDDDAR